VPKWWTATLDLRIFLYIYFIIAETIPNLIVIHITKHT